MNVKKSKKVNLYNLWAIYSADSCSPRTRVNPRELARIRADSAGVRQQFAADFFSEHWRSSPRTGELFAKNFVRQKSFASTKSNY